MGPDSWTLRGRTFMIGAPIALLNNGRGHEASVARFCYAPSKKYPNGKNLIRAEFRSPDILVRLAEGGRCLSAVCERIAVLAEPFAGADLRATLDISAPVFLTNAVSAIVDVEGADALLGMQGFFGRDVLTAELFEIAELLKS